MTRPGPRRPEQHRSPDSLVPAADPILNPETRAVLRAAYLETVDDKADTWVFGYGSLMWNPGFDHVDCGQATLYGWHRSFCIFSHHYRGTPENPGLVLGLDWGGSCHGMVYRVPGRDARAVLGYLWDREMVTGVYQPRTLTARLEGRRLNCRTFTASRTHVQYAGRLSIAKTAAMIAGASGVGGANRDYLANTVAHLDELGIGDGPLHAVLRAVEDNGG